MSQSTRPRALVLRAPGINCDRETAHACRLAGFATDQLHINQLIKAPRSLLDYHLLVIPGGFSYGDDLGAGTLLAKNLTIHLGEQIDQFINDERLILGICNGFQALVRAGLLPGQHEYRATLTGNASARFECRWVTLSALPGRCIFTRNITRSFELPVAHGEGQFVMPGDITHLLAQRQIPLIYTIPGDDPAPPHPLSGAALPYPYNPNGSLENVAGVCNTFGNILGLMPHPERYVSALQHPQRRGQPDGSGDGLLIFKNAYDYALQHVAAQFIMPGSSAGAIFPLDPSPRQGAQRGYRPLRNELRRHAHIDRSSYAASGVDISAADQAKALMKEAVRSTYGPEVLAGIGAFAGIIDITGVQQMRKPALVASTDGVGTKTLIAAQAGRYDTIGFDLVNHSVNDLLAQGARPLFFMDYLAMGKLDPMQAAAIVQSVAAACREVGCAYGQDQETPDLSLLSAPQDIRKGSGLSLPATPYGRDDERGRGKPTPLLGGETAEMPDVYVPGAFDLAGTIVGVVEQDRIIDGRTICSGDELLGLPSSGLHTNGYSLARRVFAPYGYDTVFPELGEPLVDALLRPHRCYLSEMEALQAENVAIKGIAHITGGGFAGNISRILPTGTRAVIERQAWDVPPLFALIARLGNIGDEEMYGTFNMGAGMVLILAPGEVARARSLVPELFHIGYVTGGDGVEIV